MLKLKAIKLPIIENKAVKGGLKDSIQRYSIYYLYPIFDNITNELVYPAKISIEHFIEKEGIRQRPFSLRFNGVDLFREFILELAKALGTFEKMQHNQISINSEYGTIFFQERRRALLEGTNEFYKRGLLECDR